MSIEALSRVTIAFPASRRGELLSLLHERSVMHIEEPPSEVDEAGFERTSVSTEEFDARVSALSGALEVMDSHAPPRKTLIESFFGVETPATMTEVLEAASGVDAGGAGTRAERLRDGARELSRRELAALAELAALEPFRGLPFTSADILRLKRTKVVFGMMKSEAFNGLRLDPSRGALAVEELRRRGKDVLVMAAFRPSDRESAGEILRRHSFEEIPLPVAPGGFEERARELAKELDEVAAGREELHGEAVRFASERRLVDLASAHWEDRRALAAAAAFVRARGRIGLVSGWVRKAGVDSLMRELAEAAPYATAQAADPAPSEDVPVSIKLPGLLRPMQLLIRMFGLPSYWSFDPTAYLSLSFLVFFGCCFGDVGYGIVLMALSAYAMIRYRRSWVKGFFQLFLYAGAFSLAFGLITGAWFGDLVSPAYMAAGNPLVQFRNRCMLLDPLDKPLLALGLALGMGVLNQFYGIVLKMKLELMRGDWAAALFDCFLWLVLLPGAIVVTAPMFVAVPEGVLTIGWWLLGLGLGGLVLTQGRKEKGVVGKALTGVVSVYGILGSYGVTSFIGDVLSYSRLLALGLTTSIVAMSFNIIAGLVKTLPVAGPALFVAALLFGHVFNFLVSILGAFVHPARLILLEFFNRFYEGGAREFRPLGFSSDRVAIVERT